MKVPGLGVLLEVRMQIRAEQEGNHPHIHMV